MKTLLNWQIEYIAQLDKMTNAELWDEYKDNELPDDWGCSWTKSGYWRHCRCSVVLESRLARWLNEISEK